MRAFITREFSKSDPGIGNAPRRTRTSAFALISTLIILVIATVLAVGFMTTSALDRSSAHAYTNIYDSQLAANMGLEAAKRALSVDPGQNGLPITMNDSYIVVQSGDISTTSGTPTQAVDSNGNVLCYYFIGMGSGSSASTGTMTYYPLFAQTSSPPAASSGVSSGTSISVSSRTTPPPDYALTGTDNAIVNPALFSSQMPQVNLAWITATTATSTSPGLRYTYWIEDMGGYIDADVAGNISGSNQTHTRAASTMQPLINSGSAYPASMVALWTLFNPTSPLCLSGTPGYQDNINVVMDRAVMLTPNTILQALSGSTVSSTSTIQRGVVAGLRPDTEQELIPYGLGYANAGQPKTNLNAIISSVSSGSISAGTGVVEIASAINTNLPNFASLRKGGLVSTLDYNQNIAANILGYALSSTFPPVVSGSYRGLGAYPLVNEMVDEITYVRSYGPGTYPPGSGTNTNALAEVTVSSWVELWNMTSGTISGTYQLNYVRNTPMSVGVYSYLTGTTPGNGSVVSLSPASSSNPMQFASGTITVQPNQFYVSPTPFTTTYYFNSGAKIVASTLSYSASLASNYQLDWNGVLVDAGYRDYKGNSIISGGTSIWEDSCAVMRCTQSAGEPAGTAYFENPGDPRASYYVYQGASSASGTTACELVNYFNASSFGARNYRGNQVTGSGDEPIYAEVEPRLWADGGHDTAPPNVPSGGWSSTMLPTAQSPPAYSGTNETTNPVVFSGSGSLSSITELGNIYDPAQWYTGVRATNSIPSDSAASGTSPWYDIPSSATSSSAYGGGFNLRIGKREFTKFNQSGTLGADAWQLMDIFSTGSNGQTVATRQTQGLVNINTASYNTLRALGAGLAFTADPNIQPTGLQSGGFYPPYVSQQADAFANAVILARSNSPFLSTAQLSQVMDTSGTTTSGTNFFGNMNEWTSGTAPTEWTDAGSKEYFSRIYDLTSVRSRNFRIYVLGQAVDKNGKVLSTARKVYQVFLNPQRNANGTITSQNIQVTYEKDL